MIALFVLFVVFAVAIPVVLEERRHRGDNVLKRSGLEIVRSPVVRRLGLRVKETRQAASAAFAALFVFIFVVLAVFGLIGAIFRALL